LKGRSRTGAFFQKICVVHSTAACRAAILQISSYHCLANPSSSLPEVDVAQTLIEGKGTFEEAAISSRWLPHEAWPTVAGRERLWRRTRASPGHA
jgi:hypothetical protein